MIKLIVRRNKSITTIGLKYPNNKCRKRFSVRSLSPFLDSVLRVLLHYITLLEKFYVNLFNV